MCHLDLQSKNLSVLSYEPGEKKPPRAGSGNWNSLGFGVEAFGVRLVEFEQPPRAKEWGQIFF